MKAIALAKYWTFNLVGGSWSYSLNFGTIAILGTLYAFGVLSSPIFPVILGVLSPVLSLFCIYTILLYDPPSLLEDHIPRILRRRIVNRVLLVLDSAVLLIINSLVIADILNLPLVRLLIVVFLPLLSLRILRVFYQLG